MELKDTIEKMQSADYKERFYAEYWQLKIRYHKLVKLLIDLDAGKLNFKPFCPYDLLIEQVEVMGRLLDIYEKRAIIERVDLKELLWKQSY